MNTTTNTDNSQTVVKMAFDGWNALMKQFDTALSQISDEQLEKQVAIGKNRGIYILGHLIAVNDAMLPLLGMGEKLHPELYEPFIISPDKAVADIPSAKVLRAIWAKHNDTLAQKFASLTTEQWFEKHTAVSPEDFASEPHRNKLNIILTRTYHLSYHLGQIAWFK